ncbi:MAG: PhzF family phenazine biosynthesis protein, partial [Salibacteraceae bacterium]
YAATAPAKDYDCVSRVLLPFITKLEDAATGSAHMVLAPYWCDRLGKNTIHAFQASERGGEMRCKIEGTEVELIANCSVFAKGELL